MNWKNICIISILSFLSITTWAQDAVVYGKVDFPVPRTIRYSISENFVSGDETLIEVELDAKNEYAVSIELDKPAIVRMIYNKKEMWMYLWPGAYMEMNFSNNNFYSSFEYDGDAALENLFLSRYIKKFGIVDPYQSATIFPSLVVPNPIFDKMNASNTDVFYKYCKAKQKEEYDFYANYQYLERLNKSFLKLMKARMDYRWAGYILAQSEIARKNGYEIPDTFSFFLFDLEIINEDALMSYDYIAFLEEYLKYNYRELTRDSLKSTDNFRLFAEKYELVSRLYTNKTLEMMQGRLLRRIITPRYVPYLATYYQDYQDYTITQSYADAIKSIYSEAKRFANTAFAPDFELMNENGEKAKLSDFKGKVVYISFWASWCQPCLKEMNKSISNRVEVQDTNVIFLYISVDDTREKWRKGLKNISNYKVNGDYHVYGNGRRSEVARLYRVISLPQYFLVDKKGNFVNSFSKASHPDFVAEIQGMLFD